MLSHQKIHSIILYFFTPFNKYRCPPHLFLVSGTQKKVKIELAKQVAERMMKMMPRPRLTTIMWNIFTARKLTIQYQVWHIPATVTY